MNAQEIKLTPDNFLFNCKTYPPRSHYKFIMRLGRIFPSSKAQARYFISSCRLDVLNYEDVQKVETLLNKYNFQGEYKYTKSKRWVRLINNTDLDQAIKIEFNI